MSQKKVLLAMSGGIDSSVVAMLLKQENYYIKGITFRSYDEITTACMEKETGCCSINSIFEAKNLADSLGFKHSIIDTRAVFEKTIIHDFISQYLSGNTPNPCVLCNKIIKWGNLFNLAIEKGYDYLATGHYSQILEKNGRYFLRRGVDFSKDQSYFLWTLTQENLKKTLFPLGLLTKKEVRKLANDFGYEKIAKKRESQEICFIKNDDYRSFLYENVPNINEIIGEGDIINKKGKILGKHKGYPFYTLGQRKGLNIAVGKRAYITKIDTINNTITLGEMEDLFGQELWIDNINFMKYENLKTPIKAICKIRYNSPGEEAKIEQIDNKIKITFDNPVFAITPGQSAVIYENDDLIAGGIIIKNQ